MNSAADVRDLLVSLDAMGSPIEIAGHESLFESGYLDSLKLIQFVEELQLHFRIRIGARDLTPDNFESVDAIAKFIDGRMPATVPAH
jgi:acyl carrier protein